MKASTVKTTARNANVNGQATRVAVNKAAEQTALAAQIGYAGVSGFLAGFFSKPAVAKPVAKKVAAKPVAKTARRTK